MTEVRNLSSEIRLKGVIGVEPALAAYVLQHGITIFAEAIREYGQHGLSVTFERLDDLFRDLQRDSVVLCGRTVGCDACGRMNSTSIASEKNKDSSGLTSANDKSIDFQTWRPQKCVDCNARVYRTAN